MAVGEIIDYQRLQRAVQDYLVRQDMNTQIQMFIQLAEAEFLRVIRHRLMQVRFTLPTVPGQAYYALPRDYLRAINLVLYDQSNTPRNTLHFKTPNRIDMLFPDTIVSRPQIYTIYGTELRIAPVPDRIYTIEFFYFQKIPPLSQAPNGVNWLIGFAPDVYLYAALIKAKEFLSSPDEVVNYAKMYSALMTDFQEEEFNEEWSTEGGLSPVLDFYTP